MVSLVSQCNFNIVSLEICKTFKEIKAFGDHETTKEDQHDEVNFNFH